MRKFQSDGDDGIWRTISGRRIFIRNGESLSQAMARSGKFGRDDMEEQIEKEEKLSKKELQERYDIQEWEIEKIEEYTGVNYTSINDQLRKNFGEVDKCTIDVQNAIEGIDNVLNKLPKYKGTVWRKEGGDRYYIEGRTYTNYSYTSTTGWSSLGGVTQLEIKQYSGCLISQFSRNPGENEVLLPRGFKWKVTKVEHLDNGYTKVYGEEVE